jgi:hypothetical protein
LSGCDGELIAGPELGEVGAADMAGPTASPCVVTGKACPIYTTQTTGTGMP